MPKFIDYKTLVARGLFNNRTTLHRYIENHGFPRPYRLAGNRSIWREEEINAWLEARREPVGGGRK
mgnify:CR=1 FL=1